MSKPKKTRKALSDYEKRLQRIELLEALVEAVRAMPNRSPEIVDALAEVDRLASEIEEIKNG